jgi:DNA-directed RNA polymerase specialized sigma24 family protein
MSEQENHAQQDAVLRAQLRLFCHLMLGSADAADHMTQQISRRALEHPDQQENRPPERIRLFRIAADLCGVRRQDRNLSRDPTDPG